MDRLSAEGYDTDKGPNYIQAYEAFFSPHRHRAVNLLELGVASAGSLKMWRDYFEFGQIFGVGATPVAGAEGERIHAFVGDVSKVDLYAAIEAETGVGVFDIIIDDASHVGANTRASFEHLFQRRLSAGGLYVIEDWGTGYMQSWPDGAAAEPPPPSEPQLRFPSHDAGLVGYVKSLVDHMAHADVEAGGGRIKAYPIEFITFVPGLVFLKKSAWA